MHALASTVNDRSDLSVGFFESADEVRLALAGALSPKSGLVELRRQIDNIIGDRRLVLDLAEVRRINSTGVRDWIVFLRGLAHVRDVRFERCSPQVVVQLNTVFNFRGHASVASVVAPFVCIACDHEQEELIDVSNINGSLSRLIDGESRRCRSCGAATELDDLPSRYFMFLDAQ